IANVDVDVRLPATEQNGILRRPPPDARVVVACPEVHELCIEVVESPSEAKRLEAVPRAAGQHAPPRIAVDPLGNASGRRVHHHPQAPQVITDDAIRRPRAPRLLQHEIGYVRLRPVNEPGHDGVTPVQLRHDAQPILVEPPLLAPARLLPSNPPSLAV